MRLSTRTGPLYGGLSLTLCAAVVAAVPLAAQEKAQEMAIDTQRSTITIHVGKSGLPSAAAHDHTINAANDEALLHFPVLRPRLKGAEGDRELGFLTITRRLLAVQLGNIALVGEASGSVDAVYGRGAVDGVPSGNRSRGGDARRKSPAI